MSNAQARTWTRLDLLNWTKGFFERKGVPAARLEAELLLAHALNCPRIKLYADFDKAVEGAPLDTYRALVKRRGDTREPLQYLTGETEFLGLKIKCSRAALIPRPETEELGEWALARLKEISGEALRVLDIGTGTGCLAFALASREARAQVTATDLSAEALALAKENAVALEISEPRVAFAAGDLFGALDPACKDSFDLIVSNPPYIDPELRPTLAPEVREHEPASALFAPEKGLAVIARLVAEAPVWLKEGGWLGIEISPEQAGAVKAQLEAAKAYESIEILKDLDKHERFALGRRCQKSS